MIALQSSGQSAVYIDHNQLINQAYNANANTTSKYYLKTHIFDFKAKPLMTTDVTNVKRRKRKSGNNVLSDEAHDLKNTCNDLLRKLKETKDFTDAPTTTACIERIWEEPTVFPQLKGANETKQFQKYTLNHKEYLIPPDCKFFNHDLLKLEEISNYLGKYDFVVMDPPWRNKYIRRIKKAKQELGYKMVGNDLLSDIPLDKFIHRDSIVAVWCTNSQQHQRALLEEFFPRWDLCLLQRIIWFKLNTIGNLVGEINEDGKKQPYEVLFIARHKESQNDFSELKKIKFFLSIPSIIHSHKPPIWEIFRDTLPRNSKCLELFARYLQPGYTSIGLEVLKLMDARLYSQDNNS